MESPANRAAQYRKQAAVLRAMAAEEIDGSPVKTQLLDLAVQYERLAAETEKSPY